MRGVIMSVENDRAVLLTRGGDFVNIQNKSYCVGDRIKLSENTRWLYTAAASFLAVCAGIGSYFMPAGYVSVDINPSVMMTVNIYDRVIDARALNDDAKILLKSADIKGRSTNDTVDILIKESERIGYLNENNSDVIVEIVSNIGEIKIEKPDGETAKVTVERADKSALMAAREMNVSIAKAKAIREYTDKNGGTIKENAAKFENKTVKEIRNDLGKEQDSASKEFDDMTYTKKIANETVKNSGVLTSGIKTSKKPANTKKKEDLESDRDETRSFYEIVKDRGEMFAPAHEDTERDESKPNNGGQLRPSAENIPHFDISDDKDKEDKVDKYDKEDKEDKEDNRPELEDDKDDDKQPETPGQSDKKPDKQEKPERDDDEKAEKSERGDDDNDDREKPERDDDEKPEKPQPERDDDDDNDDEMMTPERAENNRPSNNGKPSEAAPDAPEKNKKPEEINRNDRPSHDMEEKKSKPNGGGQETKNNKNSPADNPSSGRSDNSPPHDASDSGNGDRGGNFKDRDE